MKIFALLLVLGGVVLTGCEKREKDEPQRSAPGALLPGGDVHYGGK